MSFEGAMAILFVGCFVLFIWHYSNRPSEADRISAQMDKEERARRAARRCVNCFKPVGNEPWTDVGNPYRLYCSGACWLEERKRNEENANWKPPVEPDPEETKWRPRPFDP
jgi:hypothetical protein